MRNAMRDTNYFRNKIRMSSTLDMHTTAHVDVLDTMLEYICVLLWYVTHRSMLINECLYTHRMRFGQGTNFMFNFVSN